MKIILLLNKIFLSSGIIASTVIMMLFVMTPAMAQIGVLSFQNPSVFDTLSGNPVNTINVDQLVQIGVDLENSQSPEQSFAYVVQIVNVSNNVEVDYQWIIGSLSTGTSFSPSLTWEPKSCGDFTANLFLYDNINDLNLLSAPLSLPLLVGGCVDDAKRQV